MKLNTEIAHCIPENGKRMTNTKKRKKSFELLEGKVHLPYKGDKFIINHFSTTVFYWGGEMNQHRVDPWTRWIWILWVHLYVFFNIKCYSTLPSVVLWICRCDTMDMKELWIWSTKYKLYLNFLLCGGSGPHPLCCSTFVFKIREKRMSQGFYTQQS